MTFEIATKYTIFAIIATVANIGSQELGLMIYAAALLNIVDMILAWLGLALSQLGLSHDALAMVFAMVLGTGVGLIVKYVLDKKYIFKFVAQSVAHDSQTFMLYSLMGLLTTVIFWGMEVGFEYWFETKTMRYVGACLGLAIGYIVKYYLDKRFVFVHKD